MLMTSSGNKPCLVPFSILLLRRLPKLHLDQMKDLKLDLARFSNALADALAIRHCKLLCDRVGTGL